MVVSDYFDLSATEDDLQVHSPLTATRGVWHLDDQEAALLNPGLVRVLHVLVAASAAKQPQPHYSKATTTRV